MLPLLPLMLPPRLPLLLQRRINLWSCFTTSTSRSCWQRWWMLLRWRRHLQMLGRGPERDPLPTPVGWWFSLNSWRVPGWCGRQMPSAACQLTRHCCPNRALCAPPPSPLPAMQWASSSTCCASALSATATASSTTSCATTWSKRCVCGVWTGGGGAGRGGAGGGGGERLNTYAVAQRVCPYATM